MKPLSTFLFCCLFFSFASPAQITNLRAGLWNDNTVWSNNAIPTATDVVVLSYNIVIDANAYCYSLDANGHSVTVNAGANLVITGNSSSDTLLTAFLVIDTTQPPGMDTARIMRFYYDSLGRNTEYDAYDYEAGSLSNHEHATYYYTGNNRLPDKEYAFSVYYSGTDSFFNDITHFYSYSNNRLIYDSAGNSVYRYTYHPSQIIQQLNQYGGGMLLSVTVDTFVVQYDAAGNIITQTDTTIQQQFYYQYDQHPNPFYHTQLNRHYGVYYMETLLEEVFARNNALVVNQQEGNTTFQSRYTYRYNSRGYPITVWGLDYNDLSVLGKALYFYGR